MSREYTIKLSEEEITRINYWFVAKEEGEGLDLEDEPLMNKLTEAKEKYTNFDKIKDEMTIDDFYAIIDLDSFRLRYDVDVFEEKEWLKSEVKE